MDIRGIKLAPSLTREALQAAVEIGEERARCRAVFEESTFQRIDRIIQQQSVGKRAAFYGTTFEAGAYGADYSNVESIEDMGAVYAHYIVEKTFPSGR